MKFRSSILFFTIFLSASFLSFSEDMTTRNALLKLQEGNARYVSGDRIYPGLDSARLEDTAKNGQHPFATIMGCSDSRVPIEHIFDAGIGDIFPIRVAGNVSDVDEIGSIEYGIEHLHTPLMVVLGHTGCGAVTAVVRGGDVGGSIPELVDNIIPAAEQAKLNLGPAFSEDLVDEAVKLNVYQSIEDLFRGSEAAIELVESGELEVIGAIYDLATGSVRWLGSHPMEHDILNDIEKNGSGKQGTRFPGSGILASLQSPVILLAVFFLFIGKKALFSNIKSRKKLFLAAFFSVAAMAVPEVVGLNLIASGNAAVTGYYIVYLVVIPLLAVLIFGMATAVSISNSFKVHLLKLKKMVFKK